MSTGTEVVCTPGPARATCDFAAAEEDLDQVLAQDVADRWARLRLAQIWARSGAGWLRIGEQQRSEERREQGRALLRRAIALQGELVAEDASFHHARLQRGEAYFALDDLVGAKADFQYVREHDPAIKETYVREAVVHRLVYVKGGRQTACNLVDQHQALVAP